MNIIALLLRLGVLLVTLLFVYSGQSIVCGQSIQRSGPDYASEVRPILSRCISCHGPATQENGLRLDSAEHARKLKAIVPHQPEKSSILARVTSTDPDLRMPPVDSGDALTPAQVSTLKSWIASGAEFTPHWAFQPVKPQSPPLTKTQWGKNAIDDYILEKLEKIALPPSPEADRITLLRRVSLDLTGLPPTHAEIQAFLADKHPDAYENQVRRLLASPHYGERQARYWLDLARYADSNGYTIDGPRTIWPWRDWVVRSLNADMPFDQFTVQQLAGDLLSKSTVEEKIATGFHRNTAFNEEGGTDPEQFRVERTVDRTNTTGTVWLGLTIGCAQCHDHKYDPISQRDYYQLYAYFNNVDEPKLSIVTGAAEATIKSLKLELARIQASQPSSKPEPIPTDDQINQLRFSGRNGFQVAKISEADATKAQLKIQPDQSVLATSADSPGETYTVRFSTHLKQVNAIRLDALTDASLPKMGPGTASNGNFVLSHVKLSKDGLDIPLAGADADLEQDKYPASDALLGLPDRGWAINPGPGKNLNQPRSAVFKLAKELSLDPENELTLVLKFSEKPAGYNLGKFQIAVTDGSGPFLALPVAAQKLITSTIAPLDLAQKQTFVDLVSLKARKVDPRVVELRDKIRKLEESATTLVMAPTSQPRVTRIQERGDFLQPGDEVSAAPPAVFSALSQSSGNNSGVGSRLDLARWLTRPDHPLTPRVTVNREWQKFFGTGLVETENDFGLQGSFPTHPELLDFLAQSFVINRWSFKSLHYLIVTSATYRQSSHHRVDIQDKDPRNKLLARQNRLRLDAETIRDNALAASGQLARTIGGPPVFPPQPSELFAFTQSQRGWTPSTGPDRFRRGLYTWIWRQSRHPLLTTFDAADPQVACTRRNRSNTPLQALHLANDPVFVELASAWAGSMLANQKATDDSARLVQLFHDSVGRSPIPAESSRLIDLLQAERTAGRSELQAWSTLTRVIMNTDEFITRE